MYIFYTFSSIDVIDVNLTLRQFYALNARILAHSQALNTHIYAVSNFKVVGTSLYSSLSNFLRLKCAHSECASFTYSRALNVRINPHSQIWNARILAHSQALNARIFAHSGALSARILAHSRALNAHILAHSQSSNKIRFNI